MRASFEFDCVYGRSHTRDTGYYYNGFYCVHGSKNVNYTRDEIDPDGITDVEELYDIDTCSSIRPINSLEELKRFIDGDEEDEDYYSSLLYGVDNNK